MTRASSQAALLQSRGLDTLARFQALTERCEIPCFLMFGTLLGHVRDRGFINNDHDIDMAVLQVQAESLSKLNEACTGSGFRLRLEFCFAGQACQVSFRDLVSGLHVDLYIVSDDGDQRVIQEYSSARQEVRRYSYPREAFTKLHRAHFSDQIEVLIPIPPESILALTYGDWCVPRPNFSPLRDYRNTEVEPYPLTGSNLVFRHFEEPL